MSQITRNKKLSAKRGITLPKDIAAYAGFSGGEPIDISTLSDGSVQIRRHTPTCRFCGDREHAKTCMGIDVCPTCVEKLAQEVQGNG